jgi:hypothetical protein
MNFTHYNKLINMQLHTLQNWFDSYWQQLSRGDVTGAADVQPTLASPSIVQPGVGVMSRSLKHAIAKRFLRLQPRVQTLVDAFIDEHFTPDVIVIGVHYRQWDS